MASIRKRTEQSGKITYLVQIRKKGHDNLNGSFDTEEEALMWIDITERSLKGPEKCWKMKDMFDRFESEIFPLKSASSVVDYKLHLKFWRPSLEKEFIKDVSSMQIELIADNIYKMVSMRTGKNLTTESRRKYLMTLSYIYNTACKKWKWLQSNPVQFTDKHTDRIEKEKKEITDISEIKKQFIDPIKKELDSRGVHSVRKIASLCKMPDETIRRLLLEEYNSSLSTMKDIADSLGMKFKIVFE